MAASNAQGTAGQSASQDRLARAAAEIVVDRMVRSIFDGIRRDPTGETLREVLLGHVLSGSEAPAALLRLGLQGWGAPAEERLARIEAGIGRIAAAVASPPGRAAAATPGPSPEGGDVSAEPRGDDPGLDAGEADGEGAEEGEAGPEPKGPRVRSGPGYFHNGKPTSRNNSRATVVRACFDAATGGGKRPFDLASLLEELPPDFRNGLREIRSDEEKYLLNVLRRECISIGRGTDPFYWPRERPLPSDLGGDAVWERLGSAPPVTLPSRPCHEADKALVHIDVYNRDADPGRQLGPILDSGTTRNDRRRRAS